MVTCGRQPANMLPMAPINPFLVGFPSAVTTASLKPNSTTIVTSSPASKPRIAFSIDSIVGGGSREASVGRITQSLPSPQRSESPEPVDRRVIARSPSNSCEEDLQSGEASGLEIGKSEPSRLGVIYCRRGASLEPSPECSPLENRSRSPLIYGQPRPQTPTLSPSKQPTVSLPQASIGRCAPFPGPSANQAPLVVPGISAGLLRPLPLQAPNMKLVPRTNSANEGGVSSLLVAPPPAPLPPPPNPHFLAAHFQMAAALAHHSHQQQHQPNPDTHLPPGNPMGFFSPAPHQPNFGGPHHQLIRDSYPLYPWLLSRHGRIFPHRFPGNFLLQPFRKPKRVRTAFSPTQLLKLEHAFEGNHYVVGAERKQLAQGLSLTETQVKVWFQNRRTKHKRMQQEDGEAKSNKGEGESRNDSSQNSFEDQEEEELDEEDLGEEDEVIDMDDYGAEMDTEEHETIRAQFQQQLQHHQRQLRQHVLQQQDPPLHAQRDEQQQSQQQQQQQHLMEQHYFVQHHQNQRKH